MTLSTEHYNVKTHALIPLYKYPPYNEIYKPNPQHSTLFRMYPEMICDMDCSYFGAQHVCASDGNTYRNFCELTKAACKRSGDFKIKFVHYGPCQGKRKLQSQHIF